MRKAALGIGIGAVMIIIMFVGRLITGEIAGNSWEIRPMKLNFKDMPKKLGNWTMIESGAITPEVFEKLGATDAEGRTYKNPTGRQISSHVSVFESFHVTVPHTPLQCYPAQGWETIDQTTVEIPLPEGPPFRAIQATFEKQGEKAFVLYWFQFGDLIVVNDKELRDALEYYRPEGEWPSIVKVMIHMPANNEMLDPEPLQELGTLIYQYTRTLQDGKIPHSLSKKHQETTENQKTNDLQ